MFFFYFSLSRCSVNIEQYSQTNLPIWITKPYKVTKYKRKKNGRHLGLGKDKNLCYYFKLLKNILYSIFYFIFLFIKK